MVLTAEDLDLRRGTEDVRALADNSAVAWWSVAVSTLAWVVSSPLALMEIAVRQSAAPFARSLRAFVYRFCIAASGICGPASAAVTLLASWVQANLIDVYCLMPPACKAAPSRADTAVSSWPPEPDCQLTTRLCMLVGGLSAPPFSASLAAEMTLPFAVLVPPRGAVPPVDPAVPPVDPAVPPAVPPEAEEPLEAACWFRRSRR